MTESLCILLSVERHAVGALLDGRVTFMGTDLDLLQRAIICIIAVMLALENAALDGLVRGAMTTHDFFPPYSFGKAPALHMEIVCADRAKIAAESSAQTGKRNQN